MNECRFKIFHVSEPALGVKEEKKENQTEGFKNQTITKTQSHPTPCGYYWDHVVAIFIETDIRQNIRGDYPKLLPADVPDGR